MKVNSSPFFHTQSLACGNPRYNPVWMAQKLLARILIFLILFSALGAHRQQENWFCEGQRCSSLLQFCCCLAPLPFQDSRCTDENVPTSKRNNAEQLTAAGCNCVILTECATDADSGLSPAAAAPIAPLLATLPLLVFVPEPPLLVKTETFCVSPRGPPVRRVFLGSPSFRGPPVA